MTNEKVVRTRFAPSPTGPLHIGSARTALFSWLLARRHGGQFILRIEDTDQKRFVEGSIDLVKRGLSWLGINWDEGPDKGGDYGPYTQSERLDHYQKWAQWLLDNNKAYRAYDTSEELAQINEEKRAQKLPSGYDGRHRNLTPEQEQTFIDEGRKPVIRFKTPHQGTIKVNDLVLGEVKFENKLLQDTVLLKSDGFPTYHLAHIVDDHLMKISHVTRSNEWLNSLPLHVHLWQAFGWEMPEYAHLPVLLNPNGKGKLSKRHAGFTQDGQQVLVLTQEFEDAGYYAPAVINFLTNIGWNFGDEREIFDGHEAIERFDITGVNPTNSAYPIEKLDWLNGIYIREKMSVEDLSRQLKPVLENAGYTVDDDLLLQVTPIVQTRIKTFNDIVDLAGFFFKDNASFTAPIADDLIQKKMDAESTRKALNATYQKLETLKSMEHQTLYEEMKALAKELGIKNGQLFGTQRVAITAQTISTPTFETMEILGKEETMRRLKLAADVVT